MKYPILFGLLAIFATYAQAQELEISTPYLLAKEPAKTKKFDQNTKGLVEVDGVKYAFNVSIKNISNKPLIVATAGLGQQTSPDSPVQTVELKMSETKTNGGSLVIPPKEELRLVEIRPNEAAFLKTVEFTTTVPLKQIKITYSPQDFYGGRFGYWTGTVSSDTLSLKGE
jgi:hypothetical protein